MIDHINPKDIKTHMSMARCAYCNFFIEKNGPIIRIIAGSAYLYVHKNCAIAFAAAVQNEYDKLP